jgi:protein SCO1/2
MAASTSADTSLSPSDLQRITYDQHLGQRLSPGLMFQESDRKHVALADLFNDKPTLLILGYYHCPMLCTLINDGLIESLQELRFDVGRDFNVIELSIDPNETPEVGAAKKREYLKRYGRAKAENGWHFLTGDDAAIGQLANEVGFRFKYDPATHEYAHPSGFVVLTPDGRISRYFFGVNYDPRELRSAIITAAKGQNGSVIKELILLCCRYSPVTGKYGELVLTVLRVLGVATLVLLAWWIFGLARTGATPNHSEEAS